MRKLKIMALSLALLPIAALAQTNIKQAFENIIDSPKGEISQSHTMAKDPMTGEKESQCDIYRFVLPKKQMQLISELEKAFRKDSEDAYTYATGKRGKNSADPVVSLAVGDGSEDGVTIGKETGMKYAYACFLAPEDSAGNHRYAYGMEWKESGNGDYLVGSLCVTYATTLKYRQGLSSRNNSISINGFNLNNLKDLGNATYYTPPTWFGTLTSYITAMTTADLTMRRALASKIYSHTKNLKNVDSRDKETARELLKTIISNKNYEDGIIQNLLNAALVNIK